MPNLAFINEAVYF